MKPFIRKKLPYILIAVQVILIMGLLFYIVPGRYHLYDIVLYDASENVPANPLTGYAPRAELEEDCEGADLVFIMLPFSEWEPQEGVFDREGVKEKYHIEEHRQAGRHAVLRFVCDLPSKHSHRDVPDWLCSISRGVDYKDASGKGYAPDYGDETFLKAHQEALDALAAWCAEDSFVSYVEIGSVGQNGDWSATAESAADLIPSGQVLEQYRQQYEEAFSGDEDILLLQSGSISAALSDADDAEGTRAAGSWKDVIGDAAATAENLSRTGAVWEKAPVGGGMTDTIPMDTLLMDNLSDTLDQIRSSHLSYIGPVCPDAEQQQSNGSEMILRNVGYCLYLSRLQTTVDFLDDTLQIHFTFNNIGAAPMYRDWPVRMYIFNKKKCICEQTLDLRLSDLLPDKEITVTGSVPYSRDLLNGFSVGIAITSPDGSEFITLAQKGVLPDGNGIHKVYRHKKKH